MKANRRVGLPECPICLKPVGKNHAHLEGRGRVVPIHQRCLEEWEVLLKEAETGA